MAKRGGFPGGAMPGNMNNLMKQAQRKSLKRRNLPRQPEAERSRSLLRAKRR